MSPRLTLTCDGVTHVVEHTAELSFGRAPGLNDAVIGSATRQAEEDTLVSRRAGLIVNEHPFLVIRNLGSALPLAIEPGNGPRRTVEVGDELRLRAAPLTISLQGRVRRYVLRVEVEGVAVPADDAIGSIASPVSPTERPLALSEERRRDLAALCAPMLGPARAARPATYAEAARRRGITRKAMQKRIEHLVADLRERESLPGLEPGGETKQVVCDWAIRTGLVTAEYLASVAGPA